MENRYKLVYDLKQSIITNIKFKQGDTNSSVLEINLVDNSLAKDITGQAITFNFSKGDGTVVTQDITTGVSIINPTNGNFQCILLNQTLAFPGVVKCEMVFSLSGVILSTATFNFTVDSSIGSGPVSANYNTAIEQSIANMNNLISQFNGTNIVTLQAELDSHTAQLANIPNQIYITEKAKLTNTEQNTIYARAIKDLEKLPRKSLTQAKKAILNGTLNVAIWGDSIAAGAAQVLPSNAWAQRFYNDLVLAFPNVVINFRNYSWGGANSGDAISNNIVDYSVLGTWYDKTKTWKANVQSFNPDLIIIAFGMNDVYLDGSNSNNASANGSSADYFHVVNLSNINAFINGWTKVPSLVFASTITPLIDLTYGPYDDRLRVQRATRNFARINGFACMDTGRLWDILQRGFDDECRYATYEDFLTNYPTKWIGDLASYVKTGGNTIGDSLTGKAITNNELFYNGEIKFVIYNRDTNAVYIKYRVTPIGYYMVKIVTGTSGSVTLYSNTDIVSTQALSINAGSTYTLDILVKDATHIVSINYGVVITYTGMRQFNAGAITVGSEGITPNIGGSEIIFDNAITSDAIYTDDALLGNGDITQSGNHNNHPTGLGHALAFVPAYLPIIKELLTAQTTEVCNYLPALIDGATMGKTPIGSVVADSGETVYFISLPHRDYKKGISVNIISTGETYTLSALVNYFGNIHSLEPKHFGYWLDTGSGLDYFVISAPGTVANFALKFNLFSWI